jgi:hypothetical protein
MCFVGKSLSMGEGDCGLGCFRKKQSHRTNIKFLCGLTTAQMVDSLLLYKDFPVFCITTAKIKTIKW